LQKLKHLFSNSLNLAPPMIFVFKLQQWEVVTMVCLLLLQNLWLAEKVCLFNIHTSTHVNAFIDNVLCF
jgi:hypothetical protein